MGITKGWKTAIRHHNVDNHVRTLLRYCYSPFAAAAGNECRTKVISEAKKLAEDIWSLGNAPQKSREILDTFDIHSDGRTDHDKALKVAIKHLAHFGLPGDFPGDVATTIQRICKKHEIFKKLPTTLTMIECALYLSYTRSGAKTKVLDDKQVEVALDEIQGFCILVQTGRDSSR